MITISLKWLSFSLSLSLSLNLTHTHTHTHSLSLSLSLSLSVCVCVCVCIYQPLQTSKMRYKINFEAEFVGLMSLFFLLLDQLPYQGSSLLYYLPIAGSGIVGSIPSSKVLALYKMQTASSRVWTQVASSISNNDNYCTMSTFVCMCEREREREIEREREHTYVSILHTMWKIRLTFW